MRELTKKDITEDLIKVGWTPTEAREEAERILYQKEGETAFHAMKSLWELHGGEEL